MFQLYRTLHVMQPNFTVVSDIVDLMLVTSYRPQGLNLCLGRISREPYRNHQSYQVYSS